LKDIRKLTSKGGFIVDASDPETMAMALSENKEDFQSEGNKMFDSLLKTN
jgi:hypothetical protein